MMNSGEAGDKGMSEWTKYRFSDFVYINPQVSLKQGSTYSFVEMADLQDGNKFCNTSTIKPFNGSGMKFRDRDTLFARITPCLENGKICQVRNLTNNTGFGSTEFHVFRGREGLSDTDFIFYLARWSDVRDYAEANFHGTSGRQRVPRESFDNLFLKLPPLPEQRAIAGLLSSLDNKIDLLHRQNKTLEGMAEAVYRCFFVDGRKVDWKECTVNELAKHEKQSIHPNRNPVTLFYHYSIPAFDESHMPIPEFGTLIQSNKYKVLRNTILFSKLNPDKDKRVWLIPSSIAENSISSTEFQVINPKSEKYLFFLYGYISYPENYSEIAVGVGGTSSSHQRIDPEVIFKFPCFIPDDSILTNYNEIVGPIFGKMHRNLKSIQTLSRLRDTLLPKLMSGEMRVKL